MIRKTTILFIFLLIQSASFSYMYDISYPFSRLFGIERKQIRSIMPLEGGTVTEVKLTIEDIVRVGGSDEDILYINYISDIKPILHNAIDYKSIAGDFHEKQIYEMPDILKRIYINNEYTEIESYDLFNLNQPLSLSVTFRMHEKNSFSKLVIKPYSEDMVSPWEMYTIDLGNSGDMPRFIITDGESGGESVSLFDQDVRIEKDRWYNIVVVYNIDNVKLYLNGDMISQEDINFNIGQNDMPLCIGGRLNENNMFIGEISDFRIYDGTLTKEQVEQNYINQIELNNIRSYSKEYFSVEELNYIIESIEDNKDEIDLNTYFIKTEGDLEKHGFNAKKYKNDGEKDTLIIKFSEINDPNDPIIDYAIDTSESYYFLHFEDEEGNILSEDPTYYHTIKRDITITAVFDKKCKKIDGWYHTYFTQDQGRRPMSSALLNFTSQARFHETSGFAFIPKGEGSFYAKRIRIEITIDSFLEEIEPRTIEFISNRPPVLSY